MAHNSNGQSQSCSLKRFSQSWKATAGRCSEEGQVAPGRRPVENSSSKKQKCLVWPWIWKWYNVAKKKIKVNIAVSKSFMSFVGLRLSVHVSQSFTLTPVLTLWEIKLRDMYYYKESVMILSSWLNNNMTKEISCVRKEVRNLLASRETKIQPPRKKPSLNIAVQWDCPSHIPWTTKYIAICSHDNSTKIVHGPSKILRIRVIYFTRFYKHVTQTTLLMWWQLFNDYFSY